VTSPRPAAPPDTGRMPSTRGGSQSNPLASPGGAGALGAPTDPLPSPAPEAGADEAAFLDAEGDPQGAGSGGTDAAAAAVAAERALEDARAQVQGLLGALGSLGNPTSAQEAGWRAGLVALSQSTVTSDQEACIAVVRESGAAVGFGASPEQVVEAVLVREKELRPPPPPRVPR
jgi:hypothetical protein